MEVLRHDLGLKIDDFGANQELSSAIRSYHDLFEDYLNKRRIDMAIHVYGQLVPIHFVHN